MTHNLFVETARTPSLRVASSNTPNFVFQPGNEADVGKDTPGENTALTNAGCRAPPRAI